MQTGQILHTFTAKNGQEVILRTPKWEDHDDLRTLMKSLISEGADILWSQPVTRNSAIDEMSRRLAAIEKGQMMQINAEINNHVIAAVGVSIHTGQRSHVGEMGIIILKGDRDMGIGTEMLKQMIELAQDRGLKVLILRVFETNSRAKHVYDKLGFHKCGRIPGEIYKNGHYIDHITMVKILDESI
jgi:RimJ/RimL family protein N-acetyltransferase